MALQTSVAVRNAQLDAFETAVGTSAVLKIRSGAQPSACSGADTGTVIATIALASDWMAAAASGAKALSNLPVTDLSADATGSPGHFRIYASDGTTCHLQGSVGVSGADMIIDQASVTVGQQFSVVSFTLTQGGA